MVAARMTVSDIRGDINSDTFGPYAVGNAGFHQNLSVIASEAMQSRIKAKVWIASSLALLAMTQIMKSAAGMSAAVIRDDTNSYARFDVSGPVLPPCDGRSLIEHQDRAADSAVVPASSRDPYPPNRNCSAEHQPHEPKRDTAVWRPAHSARARGRQQSW